MERAIYFLHWSIVKVKPKTCLKPKYLYSMFIARPDLFRRWQNEALAVHLNCQQTGFSRIFHLHMLQLLAMVTNLYCHSCVIRNFASRPLFVLNKHSSMFYDQTVYLFMSTMVFDQPRPLLHNLSHWIYRNLSVFSNPWKMSSFSNYLDQRIMSAQWSRGATSRRRWKKRSARWIAIFLSLPSSWIVSWKDVLNGSNTSALDFRSSQPIK